MPRDARYLYITIAIRAAPNKALRQYINNTCRTSLVYLHRQKFRGFAGRSIDRHPSPDHSASPNSRFRDGGPSAACLAEKHKLTWISMLACQWREGSDRVRCIDGDKTGDRVCPDDSACPRQRPHGRVYGLDDGLRALQALQPPDCDPGVDDELRALQALRALDDELGAREAVDDGLQALEPLRAFDDGLQALPTLQALDDELRALQALRARRRPPGAPAPGSQSGGRRQPPGPPGAPGALGASTIIAGGLLALAGVNRTRARGCEGERQGGKGPRAGKKGDGEGGRAPDPHRRAPAGRAPGPVVERLRNQQFCTATRRQ